MSFDLIVCADWSKHPAKGAVWMAAPATKEVRRLEPIPEHDPEKTSCQSTCPTGGRMTIETNDDADIGEAILFARKVAPISVRRRGCGEAFRPCEFCPGRWCEDRP